MALIIFATLPAGNEAASALDSNFAQMLNLFAQNQVFLGGLTTVSIPLGTVSSGTLTVNCGLGEQQNFINNGAFTLAAPTTDGSTTLLMTNGATAGAVSFSGFSVGALTGDLLTTTNANKFSFFVWRNNGTAGYRIAAHQ